MTTSLPTTAVITAGIADSDGAETVTDTAVCEPIGVNSGFPWMTPPNGRTKKAIPSSSQSRSGTPSRSWVREGPNPFSPSSHSEQGITHHQYPCFHRRRNILLITPHHQKSLREDLRDFPVVAPESLYPVPEVLHLDRPLYDRNVETPAQPAFPPR
ncbi:hypothetical protein Taro_015783 [Colocasia esculenta]|uniref:Uncharacterized protein n=1 Tax=Colocasia esculenta TaxID=4460 RepID=A0A843UII3_COLES|nr:hypothetical protein [Colocasia esculenta]